MSRKLVSKTIVLFGVALMAITTNIARAAELVLVQDGKTTARIVSAEGAGPGEKMAAADLQKYIEMMSGAKPEIVVDGAGDAPAIFVGSAAIKAQPKLQADLDKTAKKNPTLRADAIVIRREGNRVYVAGNNDDSHRYAVGQLLQLWGCRWFMPTEFGEAIPDKKTLSVDELNVLYAPPFEVRNYWLAWNADASGHEDFKARNGMNNLSVPAGHHPGISDHAAELIPAGKSAFNIPLAEEKTMDVVAAKVEPMFAKGESFSFGMADGVYISDSARDKEIQGGAYDKYMMAPMLTDNFMTLYNGAAKRLLEKHPNSTAKIGFLAYTNITIPPQKVLKAEKPLVAYLAPIDIDPIHGMDDPNSPPRQEYRAIMERWAKIMEGRVIIYDYDQGMLVWRDLPAPSIQSFRQDVKHYRDAGVLGISTESRGALATTFFNIYLRSQLMWNPDANVDALLDDFYEKFYGPAAAPMKRYWNAIIAAWQNTLATEHEYMLIPAVYTPQLVAQLKKDLTEAETLSQPLQGNAGRNEKLYLDRMVFTRSSFDIIENYTAMIRAAATEGDYKSAVAFGDKALAARLKLSNQSTLFTTRVVGVVPESEAGGAAWFPGEVKQYKDLETLKDGTKGVLVAQTPLEWAFHRDPHDSGLARGWAYEPVDLTFWNANKAKFTTPASRKDYPTTQWEMLRTDLYAQAQGVRHPDGQNYTGFGWYRTSLNLKAEQSKGKVRLMFPGLFNECWLYVNGTLVSHREFPNMWWNSDYKFEWDVPLEGVLQPGENTIALRFNNPHHFGGIFRRPFLYRAK